MSCECESMNVVLAHVLVKLPRLADTGRAAVAQNQLQESAGMLRQPCRHPSAPADSIY